MPADTTGRACRHQRQATGGVHTIVAACKYKPLKWQEALKLLTLVADSGRRDIDGVGARPSLRLSSDVREYEAFIETAKELRSRSVLNKKWVIDREKVTYPTRKLRRRNGALYRGTHSNLPFVEYTLLADPAPTTRSSPRSPSKSSPTVLAAFYQTLPHIEGAIEGQGDEKVGKDVPTNEFDTGGDNGDSSDDIGCNDKDSMNDSNIGGRDSSGGDCGDTDDDREDDDTDDDGGNAEDADGTDNCRLHQKPIVRRRSSRATKGIRVREAFYIDISAPGLSLGMSGAGLTSTRGERSKSSAGGVSAVRLSEPMLQMADAMEQLLDSPLRPSRRNSPHQSTGARLTTGSIAAVAGRSSVARDADSAFVQHGEVEDCPQTQEEQCQEETWSHAEDAKLLALVITEGAGKWTEKARRLKQRGELSGTKTPRALNKRWHSVLNCAPPRVTRARLASAKEKKIQSSEVPKRRRCNSPGSDSSTSSDSSDSDSSSGSDGESHNDSDQDFGDSKSDKMECRGIADHTAAGRLAVELAKRENSRDVVGGVLEARPKAVRRWQRKEPPTWRDFMDLKHRCVVQDDQGAWYDATVVDIKCYSPQVKIRFRGWETKYDEWIDRYSERLQPPGSRSVAHGDPNDVESLPLVTREQACALLPGADIWLRWDSPGLDGHDEWFFANISASQNYKPGVKGKRKTKTARAWAGWYKLDFYGFQCTDPFDLALYAERKRLRTGTLPIDGSHSAV